MRGNARGFVHFFVARSCAVPHAKHSNNAPAAAHLAGKCLSAAIQQSAGSAGCQTHQQLRQHQVHPLAPGRESILPGPCPGWSCFVKGQRWVWASHPPVQPSGLTFCQTCARWCGRCVRWCVELIKCCVCVVLVLLVVLVSVCVCVGGGWCRHAEPASHVNVTTRQNPGEVQLLQELTKQLHDERQQHKQSNLLNTMPHLARPATAVQRHNFPPNDAHVPTPTPNTCDHAASSTTIQHFFNTWRSRLRRNP